MEWNEKKKAGELVSGQNDDGNILLPAPSATCFSCFIEIPPTLLNFSFLHHHHLKIQHYCPKEILFGKIPREKAMGAQFGAQFGYVGQRTVWCSVWVHSYASFVCLCDVWYLFKLYTLINIKVSFIYVLFVCFIFASIVSSGLKGCCHNSSF